MKKALTRTIIVCVAINLLTAGFAFAQQNAPDEEKQASKEALAAQKEEPIAEAARKQMKAAQKKMEAAQKEMEAAQKKIRDDLELRQVEIAQKQVELMIPEIPEIEVVIPRVSIPGWQYSRIGSILVIPAAEMKVEDLATITEDMSVMSRIFDKKLSEAHLIAGRGSMFIGFDSLSFGRGSGAVEAIYLEGYGALFLMKVNALLSPPPEAQQEKETEEEDTDPLWTEMRRRMYEPEEVSRRRRGDRPEEKYDAEKVEELKETLIKTLKHAANIRALKLDESVILTVIGKAGQSAGVTIKAINRIGGYLILDKDKRTTSIVKAPSLSDIGFSLPTVLTIRAKKSDIDAFAKGQLTFDQFHQRIQLLSYSYLGENISAEPSRSSFDLRRSGRRSGSRSTFR